MERQHMNKRRRVYSPDHYDIIEATFTRKFVSYLAPAIMHVNDHENGRLCKSSKKIKHQVDMALALSSQGFAWSSALKDRLQKNTSLWPHPIECQNCNDIPEEKKDSGKLSIPNAGQESMSKPFGKNSDILNKSPALKVRSEEEKEENKGAAEETEDNSIEKRLEYLRTLIPGGNDMEADEFFQELRGYIICLNLQVNVLRHLVDSN